MASARAHGRGYSVRVCAFGRLLLADHRLDAHAGEPGVVFRHMATAKGVVVDGQLFILRDCAHGDEALTVNYNALDRKSTRLNSSHEWISYAVFCLKKKKKKTNSKQ